MSIGVMSVNRFTVRRDVLRQGDRISDGRWLGWMETTMSENKSIEKTRELTEDELNHVSGGGNPKGGSHDKPLEYLKVTMSDVLISSYSL